MHTTTVDILPAGNRNEIMMFAVTWMGLENNTPIEETLIQKTDAVLLFVGPNFKLSNMSV